MSRCQLATRAGSWVARILTFQDILMIRRWKRWRLAPETLTFGREQRCGGYQEQGGSLIFIDDPTWVY